MPIGYTWLSFAGKEVRDVQRGELAAVSCGSGT